MTTADAADPPTPSAEHRRAYADLRGALRRVDRDADGVDGVWLRLPFIDASPVPLPGEDVVGRFGGVLALAGTFRGDDDPEDRLSMGSIAEVACEILVTSERAVFSMVHGETRIGAAVEQRPVVIDYPWALVDCIEMPRKTGLADRIAGGRQVTLCSIANGAARFAVVPRSEISEPPGGKPFRKVKSDEFMGAVCRAAGAWRSRVAVDPFDRRRAKRAIDGHFDTDGDELVAWFVDPAAKPSDRA